MAFSPARICSKLIGCTFSLRINQSSNHPAPCPESNNPIWFVSFLLSFLFENFDISSIDSNICALSQNSSIAHDRISDSRDFFVITSLPHFSTKSSRFLYLVSHLELIILSIGPSPIHLIALSQNLIVFLSMKVKCFIDSLILGGSTEIHFFSHSDTSITTLSIFHSSETITAVKNSALYNALR